MPNQDVTPLKKKLTELIGGFESRRDGKLSGQQLATLIGKSRNLLSQIMNDGLIPSGDVLIQIAVALGADAEETHELLITAMRTKAAGRSRDSFWLDLALKVNDRLSEDVDDYERFLAARGMEDAFRKWQRRTARTRGRKTSPKKA